MVQRGSRGAVALLALTLVALQQSLAQQGLEEPLPSIVGVQQTISCLGGALCWG